MAATLTQAERWAISEAYKAGMAPQQICELTRRSYGTVMRVLKQGRMSTARRGPWALLTEEQRETCKNDYRRGYSLHYLSGVYGVTSVKIKLEMDAAGIQKPSNDETGIERLHDCRDAAIHDYTTDAVSIRDVARRFGVHEGTMKNFLAQHVELKSQGGQPGEKNAASRSRHHVDSSDRDHGKYWGRRTVELALGKKLPKGWVIHHMNESPRDQRHSNLWLFPSASLHRCYHAQQSEILAAGALIPANQTALENDGLWLPELLVLLRSEPDKVEQLLSCMQETPSSDQQESELELAV